MGGKPRPRLILGWREWVELPELADEPIKAKVDTGAATSALHAENIRIVRRRGERFARFLMVPHQENRRAASEVIAPLVGHREVRSSNGAVERRPVVRTRLAIGGRVREVEMTLTERGPMGFRMLIGRQAIRRLRAAVDPMHSFVASAAMLDETA